MLALGYFKAKRRFFSFQFKTVRDDVRFIKQHDLPEASVHLPMPSRKVIKHIHTSIVNLHHFIADTTTIKQSTEKKVDFLVKQKNCLAAILTSLLFYLDAERMILPTKTFWKDAIFFRISTYNARVQLKCKEIIL